MLAEKDTVRKLIPQDPPMIMVDALLSHDNERTLTSFDIDSHNIFVENGLFTESGLMENMAQSAALRTGWIARMEHKEGENFTPPIGVIGSIKGFKLYRLPDAGSRIETEIIILTEIFNATMAEAIIRKGDEILAECELKIFLQD